MEYSQKSTSGSEAVNVFNISGNTTVPFLHPGCSVDIEMRKIDTNESSYFTKIMITETTHEIDTIGHYSGSFNGIASDAGFFTQTRIHSSDCSATNCNSEFQCRS